MTRRSLGLFVLAASVLFAAWFPPCAGAAQGQLPVLYYTFDSNSPSQSSNIPPRIEIKNTDSFKSSVLEGNVAYLRVGDVGKNLRQEIQSAQTSLAATNKIAGFVLDLRFADGTDMESAGASAEWLARQKLPVAILVNGGTRGAAIELAKDLRAARAGLIFGISTEIKPDIAVTSTAGDEKKFLENPYAVAVTSDTNSPAVTNNLPVYVDHTSEADLVRARI
jgi:hypothetical protein